MVDELLDALGLPTEAHADAGQVLALYRTRCGKEPSAEVAGFLSRAMHGAWADHAAFGELELLPFLDVEEFAEDRFDDPSMQQALPFGCDGGGRYIYLDPSLGLGRDAVFVVSAGAPFAEDADRLSEDLVSFLRALRDQQPFDTSPVSDLRQRQVAAAPPAPRTGDGRLLPTAAFERVTFHLGVDAVHEVHLRCDFEARGLTFGPGSDQADLSFHPDGSVERGRLASDQMVDGMVLLAGTFAAWNREGRLIGFTPRDVVVVHGVPCAPGVNVHDAPPTFFVTPAEDTIYQGWPCKAGCEIHDYGPGLGLHLTTAKAHQSCERVVPPDVRVTVMGGGGVRFDLVAPYELEGKRLPAGTHVWFEADGSIREIHPKP